VQNAQLKYTKETPRRNCQLVELQTVHSHKGYREQRVIMLGERKIQRFIIISTITANGIPSSKARLYQRIRQKNSERNSFFCYGASM
jgi:hypothetical protein